MRPLCEHGSLSTSGTSRKNLAISVDFHFCVQYIRCSKTSSGWLCQRILCSASDHAVSAYPIALSLGTRSTHRSPLFRGGNRARKSSMTGSACPCFARFATTGESGAGEDVARLRKRCQRVFRYSRNEAYLFRFLLRNRRLLPDMGGVGLLACGGSPVIALHFAMFSSRFL